MQISVHVEPGLRFWHTIVFTIFWECFRGLYESTVLQNELKRILLQKPVKNIFDWAALFLFMPGSKEWVWINHFVFQQLDAIKNVELVFVEEMNSNRNAVVINETASFKLHCVLDTASYPVHDLTISSGIGRRVVSVQSFAHATMQEVIRMEYVPELFALHVFFTWIFTIANFSSFSNPLLIVWSFFFV